jgi:hypothetical protein
MKLYVGVTDNDWYGFLRSGPELNEVNFWQPSGAEVSVGKISLSSDGKPQGQDVGSELYFPGGQI